MSAGDESNRTIRFGTDGWRAAGPEFTLERVRKVAHAVITYLDDKSIAGPIAVGYDARSHSREAAEQLARVVAAKGRDVTLTSQDCPTPVLAWTTADGPFAGGLMVTASHNPPEYNGVKFVTSDGKPALPTVTDAIETRLDSPTTVDADSYGSISEQGLSRAYTEHAQSFVDTDLDGMSIAYDAMHGSGRRVTANLLADAGADLTRLRCERDPSFGGQPPEPKPATAGEVRKRVQEGPASLGFINDGDADRLGVVTPERGYLDPNLLLAVIYEYLLEQSAGDIVRTVSTSSLVDGIAAAHDQSVHETAVGFKWVAAKMGEVDTLAGGEESGGYGVTVHLRNKDGVMLALLIAAAHREQPLDNRLDAIIDEHGPITQDRRSIDCPDERKAVVLDELEAKLPETFAGERVEDVLTVDGFKIVLADGTWVLMRPSGTEPKLRIYAEAQSDGRVEELLDAGVDLVQPLVHA